MKSDEPHRIRRPLTRLASLTAIALSLAATSADTASAQPARGDTGLLTGSATPLDAGLSALEHSRYGEARQQLEKAKRGPKRGEAWLALARLSLLEGKHDEAIESAKQASRSGGRMRWDAAALTAEALAGEGKMNEAVAAVRAVENEPEARRARVILGQLLILTGDSAGARAPLMTLVRDYNDDKINDRDPEGLALVGRAAHLLRSAADANDAYNESEKTGTKTTETLLWRSELFLEKYDTGHAEEVLKEVLERAPDHPDALVLMARVKLDQAYDFAAADKLIERALRINPKHTGAFFIRAGLALRDFDLGAADAALDQGLRVNPNDLDLLSMRATVRFLADDKPGFEAARKAVLQRNAEFSEMYQIIGEFAEWEHRYAEIVAMMQDAVQVNPRDGKAWSVLGLNLIRLGEEQPGVEALRKSWKYDRFNVRVYNTLNLFEKDIPNRYDTVLLGSFRFRFDKQERALLERYVPPMLEEAFASMVRRYKYKPELPVGIELYSDPQHFSVRTSGLPAIGIQGVCFGRTLASISPKGDKFNWGNVLWHELGHVFAIQVSKSHVPRWFTEGLSEYETFVRYPEWQREEDMPLYMALKANRIPKVANFNRAFTHVDNPGDVTMAYYAASQIVVYIGEQFGMDKLVEMLGLWGQGVRDPQVIKRALGIDMDELDRRFRAWLAPRLSRYERQFVPDMRAPALEEAQKAADAAPNDARKQIELVIALASEGKVKEAKAALDALAKSHPDEPHVAYLEARFQMSNKDIDGAKKTLEQLVGRGHDGYAVRMQLADIAEAQKDLKVSRAHLEAARRFDPTQVEAIQALHDLAKKAGRKGDVIAALRELSVLDQHEPRASVRLLAALAEAGLWDEARQVGQRAIYVDLDDSAVHRLYGEAMYHGKKYDQALFELESAILCEPKEEEAAAVFLLAAKVYRDMGRTDDARKAAQKVLEIDPGNAEAKAIAK
jgi:tetratricopeptide (TPR) repeat protein